MGMGMIFRGGKEKRGEMGTSPGDTSPRSRGPPVPASAGSVSQKPPGFRMLLKPSLGSQDAFRAGIHLSVPKAGAGFASGRVAAATAEQG